MSIGNTTIRIVVSAIAIPAIVLASYFGRFYFFTFAFGIGVVSYYEFWLFVKNKDINANLTLGVISVGLLITNTFKNFIDFYSLLILILVILTITELFRNKGSAIFNIGSTLLGVLYFGLFASALLAIREFYQVDYEHGGLLIISIFASIWFCDSAAFFGGSALGKHKLFPRVSPNKSWEGALFGLLFAIIAMVISKVVIINFLTWVDVIAIGLIVGIIGQIGDLIESLFKRDASVKDSSNIIPGHGGIFDRFDSLLYSAPAIFLYIKYLI
jgi:phosphatidate cytidylyltransferase